MPANPNLQAQKKEGALKFYSQIIKTNPSTRNTIILANKHQSTKQKQRRKLGNVPLDYPNNL
jgi:hypothetical protein